MRRREPLAAWPVIVAAAALSPVICVDHLDAQLATLGLAQVLQDEPERDAADASFRLAENLLCIYGIPADEAKEICQRSLPDVDVLTTSPPANEPARIEIAQ
jgi:hypothetical protein